MNNFKLILYTLSSTLLVLLPTTTLAYTPQRGNVHTILGPFAYKTNYHGVAAEDKVTFRGVSWIILGDVSDYGSLKITTSFMDKLYYFRDQGYTLAERAELVQASAGYMHWFNKSLGVSFALFTSYPIGNSDKIYNSFPQSLPTPTTTAEENSETGLDLAILGELWQTGRYALIVEGRYLWSFTKKRDEVSDQYGILLGIRYFFQGKDTARE